MTSGIPKRPDRPIGGLRIALTCRTSVRGTKSKCSNPKFDRLLTMAEGTLDVTARRELMVHLETIMQDDGPVVQPGWGVIFTFHGKRVQGFKMHPTLYIFGHQLAMTA